MYALNIYISKTLIKMVYCESVSSEKKKGYEFLFLFIYLFKENKR